MSLPSVSECICNLELCLSLRFYSTGHGWQGDRRTGLIAAVDEIVEFALFDARPRRSRAIPHTSLSRRYPRTVARSERKPHPVCQARRFRTEFADNDRGLALKTMKVK